MFYRNVIICIVYVVFEYRGLVSMLICLGYILKFEIVGISIFGLIFLYVVLIFILICEEING